jgi:PhzF family phenazine biosynthesis protein
MKLPLYQVDAFAERPFSGNPAAVVVLDSWLPYETMQAIAAENNLAETAFVLKGGSPHGLRWFTPEIEMDLCGHATLATAFVFREYLGCSEKSVSFATKSGILSVEYDGDLLLMNFPRRPGEAAEAPKELIEGLRLKKPPFEVLKSRDWLVALESESEVRALKPDFRALALPGVVGVIVTAPGEEVDFVSRFFAPNAGIPEDPVTGSSHSTLIPYWAGRLGKAKLEARQLSKRGGSLSCEDLGERVIIGGRAVSYLEGTIKV